MQRFIGIAALAASALVASSPNTLAQRAQPAALVKPAADAGFSAVGLQRLMTALQDEVKAGNIPGGGPSKGDWVGSRRDSALQPPDIQSGDGQKPNTGGTTSGSRPAEFRSSKN